MVAWGAEVPEDEHVVLALADVSVDHEGEVVDEVDAAEEVLEVFQEWVEQHFLT